MSPHAEHGDAELTAVALVRLVVDLRPGRPEPDPAAELLARYLRCPPPEVDPAVRELAVQLAALVVTAFLALTARELGRMPSRAELAGRLEDLEFALAADPPCPEER